MPSTVYCIFVLWNSLLNTLISLKKWVKRYFSILPVLRYSSKHYYWVVYWSFLSGTLIHTFTLDLFNLTPLTFTKNAAIMQFLKVIYVASSDIGFVCICPCYFLIYFVIYIPKTWTKQWHNLNPCLVLIWTHNVSQPSAYEAAQLQTSQSASLCVAYLGKNGTRLQMEPMWCFGQYSIGNLESLHSCGWYLYTFGRLNHLLLLNIF